MRFRSLAAAAIVTLSIAGMAWGLLSPSPATAVQPTPTATGSSQVGFTVAPTATPTPSPSDGGSGGSGGGGAGGGGGTTPPKCVPSKTTPKLTPSPAASPVPLRLSTKQVSQGSDVLVRAEGFRVGEKVVVALYSSPVKLGVFTVRTNGEVYAEVTISKRTQLGSHTIQVTGFVDCRVAASTISVVSPHGSGTSIFPWIVWLIAGAAIGISAIGILIAFLLGWLPRGAAIGAVTRVTP